MKSELIKTIRVEIEYGSYNERRYGKPWGALVKFEGARLAYDFSAGQYLGDSGGGKVFIECQPNDIIASGQKDHRGNGGVNNLYIVQDDGTLVKIDKVSALEHYEKHKGDSSSPLGHIKTDELIAELKRRGITKID